MAGPQYTQVVAQSVAPHPGAGLRVVLVASGPGLPDVVDTYTTNGVFFQPQTLQQAAIALITRLNANDDVIDHIMALVGQPIDLTPLPPPPPDPVDHFVALWTRYRAILAAVDAQFGDPNLVGTARQAAKQFYDSQTDPALVARLDLIIRAIS